MKKFLMAFGFALLWSGCVFDAHPHHTYDEPTYTTTYVEYTGYEPEYGYCLQEEPFWEYPDWCDDWSSGVCCTWYTGNGCYEEWCVWDYSCGWEYEISWCY